MQQFAKRLSLCKLLPQLLLPGNYDNRGQTVHARWRNDKRRPVSGRQSAKPQCEALCNEILDATFCEWLKFIFGNSRQFYWNIKWQMFDESM